MIKLKLHGKENIDFKEILCILIVPLLFMIYSLVGGLVDARYTKEFLVLIATYSLISVLLLIYSRTCSIDILEPIVFVSLIYFLIFILGPVICFIRNDYTHYQAFVFGDTIKPTLIFGISFIALLCGYVLPRMFFKKIGALKTQNVLKETQNDCSVDDNTDHGVDAANRICTITTVIWIVSYAITILNELVLGRSLLSIISFGLLSPALSAAKELSIDFTINFEYCLIGAYLFIYLYSKSKCKKLILFWLMSSLFFVRGFRFVFIILFGSLITLVLLKKKWRPNIIFISLLGCVGFWLTGLVVFNRNQISYGDISNLMIPSFIDIFEDINRFDLAIFKSFYAIVEIIPAKMPFQHGKELIGYTLLMFVPRAIWPNKPMPVFKDVLLAALNETAVSSGAAMPNLGEFYFEFGTIGCIVCMFIFGIYLGWLKSLMKKENDLSIVTYSVLFPTCFQLIIRGYMPSNFYLVIFMLIPSVLVKLYLFIDKKLHANSTLEEWM